MTEYDRGKIINDPKYQENLINDVADSLIRRYVEPTRVSATSELSPEIMSCRELCDWLIIQTEPYLQSGHHEHTFFLSFLTNTLATVKSSLKLLTSGDGVEAFGLWRNLHEKECILVVFAKYGKEVEKAFVSWEKYARLEFADSLDNTNDEQFKISELEKLKAIESKLQSEMNKLKLPPKARLGFINYGWLFSVDDFTKANGYLLGFKNGLQKLAGQESRKEAYEYACKFIHPTFHSMRLSQEQNYNSAVLQIFHSAMDIANVFDDFFVEHSLYQHNSKEVAEMLSHKFKRYYDMLI